MSGEPSSRRRAALKAAAQAVIGRVKARSRTLGLLGVELVGLVAVVHGVAIVCSPAAWIVGGLSAVAVGELRPAPKDDR